MRPEQRTDDRSATHCYACLASAPAEARSCPRCHAPLDLTPARRSVGVAYLLNTLPRLVASGTIDAATAERIAAGVLPGAAEPSKTAPAVRAAPPPAPAPGPASATGHSAAEDLLGEHAPSLLLYVGAFLIVVSALIFVSVSGEQISDALKLALMVLGTGGFLTAGIVCHRIPRVVPAGRTFLAIGALLVPIDVAATYALFIGESPLTSPLLWLWGSVLAALLYAKLAIDGYGAWYSRAFFVATASATGAMLRAIDAPEAWWGPAFVALSVAHVLLSRRARGDPAARLSGPLVTPSQVLAPLPLVPMLVAAALGGFPETGDRVAVVLTVVLLTANYALFAGDSAGRLAMLAVAGLVPLTLLYLVRAGPGSYGLTLLALAAAYVLAGAAIARVRALAKDSAETAGGLRLLGYVWVAGALALVLHYEQEPATGAVVYLGATALFATIAAASAIRAPTPGSAASALGALRLDEPLVYVAAVTLHVGARYVLRALPLSPEALRGILREGGTIEWVAAGFAASLALVAATLLAARVRPHLRDATGASALASMIAVAALAIPFDGHRAVLCAAYALLVLGAAVAAGLPRALWVAGGFAAVATFAAFEWATVPAAARPVALALGGLFVYAAGLAARRSSPAFAAPTREIAIATAGLGALSAFVLLPDGLLIERAAGTPQWRSAVGALLALALLLGAESRVRRLFELAVAASASALAATLMEIARLGPGDVQAYTAPTGIYLIALALLALRYGPANWQHRVPAIEAVGALVLVTPTYARMWERDGFIHGLVLLLEVAALLGLGIVLRRRWLVAVALGALGLAALRVLVDVIDRVPNWVVFATSGALLLAVGFVLLLKRELWVTWQRRAISWWRRWEPTDPT